MDRSTGFCEVKASQDPALPSAKEKGGNSCLEVMLKCMHGLADVSAISASFPTYLMRA